MLLTVYSGKRMGEHKTAFRKRHEGKKIVNSLGKDLGVHRTMYIAD